MTVREIALLYDWECPVCDAYCRAVARRGSPAGLQLVNAREASAVKDAVSRRGLDLDEGMVLQVGDALYYGADAVHALTALAAAPGAFGRVNRWLFGSVRRAHIIYPLLRSGRNLLLMWLGRTRINNLGLPGNSRF